ncbi:hypothetical protein [Flavobacterium polysaccharolyticum]|uniref:Lipocalin-like domain-containing protein n=1 Tax=Flavobacterium polysaccharolyticum TaxID=3133148 RepID=A0ABU9NTI5_9FLAO
MKTMLLISLFVITFLKIDCQNKVLIGKYKVEFYDNYEQGYIITFRENNYYKTNLKGETIGKGEITKHLRENGEGIIHLKDYSIYIPAGKIDNVEHKSFSTYYTELLFDGKDTIQFGIHHENSDPHFAYKSGRIIKIKQ